ncbi:MAG: GAF domain-containing sensor histidine kinase [Candidatus Aenigmatarchaeota archaeon]
MQIFLVLTFLFIFFVTIIFLIYKYRKKIFLAEERKYKEILLQAASGMATVYDLDRLIKLMVYFLKRVFRIISVGIFLQEKETNSYKLKLIKSKNNNYPEIDLPLNSPFIEYLKSKKEPLYYKDLPQDLKILFKDIAFSLVVPLFTKKTLLGFVILGEKLDKTPYTAIDIDIFKILSYQLAIAIEHCLFLKEFKKTQEHLFTAEKLASIGGMAEGVAHQIKNRLNHFSVGAGEIQNEIEDFIKKYPDLLENNTDLKNSFNYINKIVNSLLDNVRRTDEVVKGILTYARLETKENFFSSFSFQEIVNLVLELLKIKHRTLTIPIALEIDSYDTIYGIKSQISEVIYNILDNAYEAIEEKRLNLKDKLDFKPLVKVKLIQNQDFSLIEISDNGIGINEENKNKIFSPFFTTKSSFKSGAGIGMYIVKRIIEENHKGKVWFTSNYGEGTTFFITLPKNRT